MKNKLKFFNTTGPCNPEDHYMLDAQERLVDAQLYRYISNKLYWVLHAPRQTGKTTFLQSWVREINSGALLTLFISLKYPRPRHGNGKRLMESWTWRLFCGSFSVFGKIILIPGLSGQVIKRFTLIYY